MYNKIYYKYLNTYYIKDTVYVFKKKKKRKLG